MKHYTVVLLYPIENDTPETYIATVQASSPQAAVAKARETASEDSVVCTSPPAYAVAPREFRHVVTFEGDLEPVL
jgi:hypothetical protein